MIEVKLNLEKEEIDMLSSILQKYEDGRFIYCKESSLIDKIINQLNNYQQ